MSVTRYQIYQKLATKQCYWVENAANLDEAKSRLKELESMFPADYFIFDTEDACLIVPQDAVTANKK